LVNNFNDTGWSDGLYGGQTVCSKGQPSASIKEPNTSDWPNYPETALRLVSGKVVPDDGTYSIGDMPEFFSIKVPAGADFLKVDVNTRYYGSYDNLILDVIKSEDNIISPAEITNWSAVTNACSTSGIDFLFCKIDSPASGTYFIRVRNESNGYSNVDYDLLADYSLPISTNVPETGLSSFSGQSKYYSILVPANLSLKATTSNGIGGLGLKILDSAFSVLCASETVPATGVESTAQSCTIAPQTADTKYYIQLQAEGLNNKYQGVTLTAIIN
jgi:hypothetical protein